MVQPTSDNRSAASFLHHIFVMSPDGQYLVRLLENLHRLIPYTVIKQTLRVGNAATMINGMVRLVLAKLSVTAMTNWIGLTNNTNDGMNLLQQIISTISTLPVYPLITFDVTVSLRKARW